MPEQKEYPSIVIIGAGFGGLELAKKLRKKPVRVTLIDQHNFHLFQPLLYQVATGGLEPDSIAYPVRKVFPKAKNIDFLLAEVTTIDAASQTVHTTVTDVPYDYLVIATGSISNFFNFTPIQEQLLPLKSVTDALNIRSYILQNMELASARHEGKVPTALFNIAIVGGGPTGVELAGALAEMKKYVFPHDYPDLEVDKMRVVLYEASSRLLSGMSDAASAKALEYLHHFGVEVNLDTMVQEYDGQVLTTKDGDHLDTVTVIWTAGVQGHPPGGLSAEVIDRGQRIEVDRFNRIPGMPGVFAIGDVAALIDDDHPKGYPMLAQVALQQAKLLAKNLLAQQAGQEMTPFTYNDKGTMATVGRSRAVVDLPYWKFQGFLAWLAWMFVHIYMLIGFRSKLSAFADWTYNFFTYDRAMRLIIRPYTRPPVQKEEEEVVS